MNYFYTVPKIELDKYPLKSNTIAVLDKLCSIKTNKKQPLILNQFLLVLKRTNTVLQNENLLHNSKWRDAQYSVLLKDWLKLMQ